MPPLPIRHLRRDVRVSLVIFLSVIIFKSPYAVVSPRWNSPDLPQSAWSRMERIQHPHYNRNARGSQGPWCPISLPMVSHITPVMSRGVLLEVTEKGASS